MITDLIDLESRVRYLISLPMKYDGNIDENTWNEIAADPANQDVLFAIYDKLKS
jgi:hypothetical protein